METLAIADLALRQVTPPGVLAEHPVNADAWLITMLRDPTNLVHQDDEHPIDPPAGLILPPGSGVRYLSASTTQHLTEDWVALRGPVAELVHHYELVPEEPFPIDNPVDVRRFIFLLARERDPARTRWSTEGVRDLTATLLRALARGRQSHGGRGGGVRIRLLALRERLRTRCEEPWSVARMAREVNLSPSRFAVLYRRHCGETPLHDLTRFRVDRATDMLQTTGAPIRRVASMCGFGDPLYFSRVYRRHAGRPPTSVRRDSP